MDKPGSISASSTTKTIPNTSTTEPQQQQQPPVDRRTSLLSTSPLSTLAINTGASPKIKKNTSLANSLNSSPMRIAGDTTVPLRVQRKWDPPILGPLPPGFLRLASNEVNTQYSNSYFFNEFCVLATHGLRYS